jgi:hypothetical protein
MNESTTAMTSSASVYATRGFWERLWRTAGLQFVGFFVIAYLVYGNQPQVGASADSLVAFYHGDRLRILIAAVFAGLNVLNLMWFAAGVAALLLVLLGGTAWLSGGFWAADGAYSRFVSPLICLAWILVVSRVLLSRSPATRAGW